MNKTHKISKIRSRTSTKKTPPKKSRAKEFRKQLGENICNICKQNLTTICYRNFPKDSCKESQALENGKLSSFMETSTDFGEDEFVQYKVRMCITKPFWKNNLIVL